MPLPTHAYRNRTSRTLALQSLTNTTRLPFYPDLQTTLAYILIPRRDGGCVVGWSMQVVSHPTFPGGSQYHVEDPFMWIDQVQYSIALHHA